MAMKRTIDHSQIATGTSRTNPPTTALIRTWVGLAGARTWPLASRGGSPAKTTSRRKIWASAIASAIRISSRPMSERKPELDQMAKLAPASSPGLGTSARTISLAAMVPISPAANHAKAL